MSETDNNNNNTQSISPWEMDDLLHYAKLERLKKQSEHRTLLRNKAKERKLFPERYEPYQPNKKNWKSWIRRAEYKDIPITTSLSNNNEVAIPAIVVQSVAIPAIIPPPIPAIVLRYIDSNNNIIDTRNNIIKSDNNIRPHKDGYSRKVYNDERKTCRVESCDNEIESGKPRGSYCAECKKTSKLITNHENTKKRREIRVNKIHRSGTIFGCRQPEPKDITIDWNNNTNTNSNPII